jgi:ribonucleoside-diphosphate reductase alpha chain
MKTLEINKETNPIMISYTREQILPGCIEYFEGDEMAADVWINKYALKDSLGNIYERTPDDMHKRIAKEFARIEKKYPNPISEKEIYEKLKKFKKIIPQGSPMAGIGNIFQVSSISNCFVIGNDGDYDSYGGILKLDQELVQLMKRRAGVGLDLSFIRPAGSPVKNSALTSTGVVPYMERYSNSTREVAQDGRRGALMESISIIHPDAEMFIHAKMDETKVTGANVSVRINDEFMNCVSNENLFVAQYPVESDSPSFTKEVNAKALWDKIIHNAWLRAEPGILFWDTIIRESIPDCYSDLGFKTLSTNPCGEITLCSNDSCRLLVLNLYGYVINPFTKNAHFDFNSFEKDAIIAQRLMDDLIDLELEKVEQILTKIDKDPEPEEIKLAEKNLWLKIREKCIQGRRTGLGITAEGDMLAALNIQYGSDEGNDFAEQIAQFLKTCAYRSSVILAKERGAFPIYDHKREKDNPFICRIKEESPELYADMIKYGRRNIALLTIAPTGTVSIMSQTTSGIEPAFLISYMRRRKINPNDVNARIDFVDKVGDSWQNYPVFHHKFKDYLEVKGYKMDDVVNMTKEEIDVIIQNSPYHKATANDVDWVKKVEMQGRVQKHVDHSISVTVNLPESVTEELVSNVYQTGWSSGCKGITIYRDGSRSGVLISNEQKPTVNNTIVKNNAPKRPKTLNCDIYHTTANGEQWIVIVGLLESDPYEVFAFKPKTIHIPVRSKNGSLTKIKKGRYDLNIDDFIIENLSDHFETNEQEALTRMISMALRHGSDIKYIVDQLNKAEGTIVSFSKAIGRTLKKYISGNETTEELCPSCGEASLKFQEGCLSCTNCGVSKCG